MCNKTIFQDRSLRHFFQGVLIAGLCLTGLLPPAVQGQVKSEWVRPGKQGKLVYKTLPRGDQIMDFSYAGYGGGGVAIPDVPVKVTLDPVAGDNTEAIQRAIDSVSRLPLDKGYRGAVLLGPGTYPCGAALRISASGVVLRGSGWGGDGTRIDMTGEPHLCIALRGALDERETGRPTTLSDRYVPSGTFVFSVADPSGLSAGDTIRISRPVTPAWVHFMGMDVLTRNGKKQTWITGRINTERVIRKIRGHQITVDVPLTDSYDGRYLDPPGTTVVKVTATGKVSQTGIENLCISSPPLSGTINERHNRAFSMSGISDSWARNIRILNTVNSISVMGSRITVDRVDIRHDMATTGAAKPADINGSGCQLLFDRCNIQGDNLFFFATGARVSGPVVLLRCVFKGNGWIQPHQRWATGLLVDDCKVPRGGIDFMNRGEYGSGHGWTIGWAVAWNSEARSLINQQPPGAANWMIGCSGEKQRKTMPFNKAPLLPEGIYDAYEKKVGPASLYLAQLKERLGEKALKNIGY